MKMLVGIPVFRIPDSVRRCLECLINTPADILVVDNASDADVKETIRRFGDRIKTIESPTNEFCNGGWNRIMQYGLENDYDVIVLGSSDAMLHPGWFGAVNNRFNHFQHEVLIPTVREPMQDPDYRKAQHISGGVAGYYMFLPREAVKEIYPIPRKLKHWYGDQYILDTLRQRGWSVALLEEVSAYHEQSSVTRVTPEAYVAIEEDKKAWGDSA